MTMDYICALLMAAGGICGIICIAYPLAALIWYPFYRRMFETDITLKEYMRGL